MGRCGWVVSFALLCGFFPGIICNLDTTCLVVTIYGLQTADCNGKNLKTVPTDLGPEVKVLKFNDNALTYLDIDQFQRYRLLQEIYLVRNRIGIIAPDAFRNLRNLQILNLESNRLSEIPRDAFQHLHSLRILSLKNNQIRYITNSAFQHLPNIEELNFENCYVERIEPLAFKGLTKLDEINLVSNFLKTLSSEMGPALPENLKIFRLHRNEWTCDCRLRWLREWITTRKINWDFNKNTPSCAAPPLINGINWKQLSPEQFACTARIVSNSSTSLELRVGGNVSIECVVFGDPEPKVIWKKGESFISKENVRERYVTTTGGEKQIRSILHLDDVSESDASDYKCIAENSAGRSEVTYKLWVEGVEPPAKVITVFGLSKLAIIGIVVGALAFLGIVTCWICCCILVYRNVVQRRQAPEYRKAKSRQNNVKDTKGKYEGDATEEEPDIKEKPRGKPAPQTELLLAKDSVEKESVQKVPEKKEPNHIDHAKEEGEFKMRIFASYEEDEAEEDDKHQKVRKTSLSSPVGNKLDSGSVLREATPDLLCDDKHTRANHKTPTPPPPPAAYYANNLVATQKRAEENPYAKPNELKSAGPKTPDTDEALLDYAKTEAKPIKIRSKQPPSGVASPSLPRAGGGTLVRGRASRSSLKDSPSSTASTASSRDPQPCTNPVCLKTHNRSKSQIADSTHSKPTSPKMSNSQSAGSITNVESPADGPPSSKSPPLDDHYKTLPSRSSLARKLPHAPAERTPAKPRVQFASPVKETPSCSSPPRHLPHPQWATLGRGGNPLHPKGLKVMSPEGPRTLTFPGAIDPPLTPPPTSGGMAKPSRTYGCSTSIDDLLSPPFSSKETTASIKKPGHKDEYGTAV